MISATSCNTDTHGMYRCMPSLRVLHPCRRYVCTGHTVSYVTDVEGNLGHWNRWADLSSAVERNKSSQELELNDNCHVVYGGDVWDRGKGDLRIIRDVVSLKKKYPSRVHIILGNRDINKIRLISELNAAEVKKDLHTYWAGRMTVDSSCIPASMADRLRLVSFSNFTKMLICFNSLKEWLYLIHIRFWRGLWAVLTASSIAARSCRSWALSRLETRSSNKDRKLQIPI